MFPCYLILFSCQGEKFCATVRVLNTNHTTAGDNGQYFYFNKDDFSKMVGYTEWTGKVFRIKQTGSTDWTGDVKVWDNDYGVVGRRQPKTAAMASQWASEDVIMLASCSGTGIPVIMLVVNIVR